MLGPGARQFDMPSSSPPQQNVVRRFAPEPIETTKKSSKQARKHSPDEQNQEHELPKVRRFSPEPIETSKKSSRKPAANPLEDSKPAVRRFAPEPIQTSKKSSKDKAPSNGLNQGSTSHITRFKPQLVDTSFGGNRSSRSSSRRTSQHSDVASRSVAEDAVPRRFQPEVLGTAKRSRRKGDANDVNYQDYKTEEGFVVHAREHQRHVRRKAKANRKAMGDDSPSSGSLEISPEMRRSIAPLDGSAPPRPDMEPDRSHSFRCPELDTIDSSESERESGHSSRRSVSPGQGSPITASDSSFPQAFYKHATRMRESVDESFSHYLLQLEQKKAARRLQEAALAAFPNSDFHEPVHHYVNSEQDGSEEMEIEDRPVTWEGFDDEEILQRAALRRESTGTVSWEQLELQRHAEQLEQDRLANKVTEKKKETHSPWWNPVTQMTVYEPQVSELKSMRDRARPPMLGNDLKFPRCPSPEPARFDVTQGSEALRKQMCYLSEQSTAETSSKGGLWAAKAPMKKSEKSISSAVSKGGAESTAGKGLWGGFCVSNEDTASNAASSSPAGPTGLMTPAPRVPHSNPFEQSFAERNGAAVSVAPPTPPESVDLNRLDAILMSESQMVAQIEREYPDSFVTQVYNYLSLGYPSLARPFDEELAKISSIPISELREDDVKANQTPRGYIRLGTDFEGGGGQGITPQDCRRWQALKLYVLEWAKQEKNFDKTTALTERGNWATIQRRGSWAI